MRLTVTILLLLLNAIAVNAQHPITFFTSPEAATVKSGLAKYPLLQRSFSDLKSDIDSYVGKDIDVPFPKDPAGGYTHDRHKANYMIMFNSGILYNITKEKKYAELVKQMLLKYARLNPTLPKHPQATSSSPGKIFWQALNDANWLVYAGMAYDLVYNYLNTSERRNIEENAFKPEVEYFTKDLSSWFNLIHNHGVWACAGVGIVGLATGNSDYVEMALKGTNKDGKSGFLAQMNGLFSPDGYYTEGPYYVRYAILPYYLFANALYHARPELKIFEFRDRILQKALLACLQQTNLDGVFFPLNDALKEKDYTSNELVTAINIAWKVYGRNDAFLPVVKKQERVLLNAGGAGISAAMAASKSIPAYFPYVTTEYKDGVNGTQGGVSFLRHGKNENLTTLIFKYTSHGLSHGHFDKLNINLFDKGNEILSDYGSVRFIGVEQKYGGRYLPENDRFANQTIAHNTIVVDEKSHFNGHEPTAEKNHSQKLFSDLTNPDLQIVAAKEENAYPGTLLQRNIYLIQVPQGRKIVIDVFKANSNGNHTYDLPFQYKGQLIKTSFKYKPFTSALQPLGTKNGYQYIWKEAETIASSPLSQLTFLNNRTYYTISSLTNDSSEIFFGRTGANDPDFNLRHEPSIIIRKKGNNATFINVVEMHGRFDPVMEFSSEAYPKVTSIRMERQGEEYTAVEIMIDGKKLVVMQADKEHGSLKDHSVSMFGNSWQWKGPITIYYDGKKLK